MAILMGIRHGALREQLSIREIARRTGFFATPFARMGASMPPVGHMAGVMHRGFVAPLAHGVHADAILPGRYPAGATGLLQCLGGSVLVPCHQHGNALAGAGHVARTAGSSARPGAGGTG